MVLSRNDKIIAVLAVVILIAVAFAIVFYQSPEEEKPETPMLKTFSVTWTKKTGDKTITDNFVEKKKQYASNFSIDDVPEGSVLTSVNVEITWKDDHTYGLLLPRGKDKLTVEISCGGQAEKYPSQGSGNKTFTFSIFEIPVDSVLEANDRTAAEENITNMFKDQNSASFDVKASVQTGERILRFLKYMKDKGNNFNLKITYEYYSPMTEQISEDDVPPEELLSDGNGTSYLGMMVAAGNFGRI